MHTEKVEINRRSFKDNATTMRNHLREHKDAPGTDVVSIIARITRRSIERARALLIRVLLSPKRAASLSLIRGRRHKGREKEIETERYERMNGIFVTPPESAARPVIG